MKVLFILTIVLEAVFVPVFLKYYWPDKCKESLIFKMLSSTMFVLCGYFAIKIDGSTNYDKLILWGLIFGWLGDLLLHALTKKMLPFILGVVAFLTGHVFYIIALQKAIDSEFPAQKTFEWYEFVAVIAIVLLVVLCTNIKNLFKTKAAMGAGLVFYGIFLALMLVKALRYVISVINYGVSDDMVMISVTVGVGAILFALSDISLGIILSGDSVKRSMRIFNILTYYVAQLLLAASVFFVNSRDMILK